MIFNQIVYGPIHSRRLGCSLGINLMPVDGKICSFNCVYCECGFNQPMSHPHLPTPADVRMALQQKLEELTVAGVTPDVLTFSGNGEPTMHPDFETILTDTCALRNRFFPQAKVSVLSNSTQLHRPDVVRGLLLADNRIMKFDSAFDSTMRLIDQPVSPDFSVARLTEDLKQFNGNLIVQTCFLRGTHNGQTIDNTTPEEVSAWLAAIETIHPQELMIYVIDRQTPVETLEKISHEKMEAIAEQARAKGFTVIVS